MNNKVDVFISELPPLAKEWIEYFVNYMRKHYASLDEVISFQMPTYKLGSGAARNYIAFGYGKNHFSLHTMDFDYIVILKEKLSRPGKGKGCVNVAFDKIEERTIIIQAIQEIVERNHK